MAPLCVLNIKSLICRKVLKVTPINYILLKSGLKELSNKYIQGVPLKNQNIRQGLTFLMLFQFFCCHILRIREEN